MSKSDISSFSKNDLTGEDILKHITSNTKTWGVKPKQALFKEYLPIELKKSQLQQQLAGVYSHQTSRRSRIEDLVKYKKVLTNKADPFEINDFICTKELLKKAEFGINGKLEIKHASLIGDEESSDLDTDCEKPFGLFNVRQKVLKNLQHKLIENVEVNESGQKSIENKTYWSKKNIKSFMTYKRDYNYISKQNDISYTDSGKEISNKNKLSLSFDFQARIQAQQKVNKVMNTRNVQHLNAGFEMIPQNPQDLFSKKDVNQSFDQSKVKILNLSKQNQNSNFNVLVREAKNALLPNANEEFSLMSQNDRRKINDKRNLKNLINPLLNIKPKSNRAQNLRYAIDSNSEKDIVQVYQDGSHRTGLKESDKKSNSTISSVQKLKSNRMIKVQAEFQREHKRCVSEQDSIQTRRYEEHNETNNEITDTNESISPSLSPERQRCQEILSKSFEIKKDLRKSNKTLKRMTRNYNNRSRRIENTFTNLQKVSALSPEMLQIVYYYNKESTQNDKIERNLVLKDYCERKEDSSALSDEMELKLTRAKMKKFMNKKRTVKYFL